MHRKLGEYLNFQTEFLLCYFSNELSITAFNIKQILRKYDDWNDIQDNILNFEILGWLT